MPTKRPDSKYWQIVIRGVRQSSRCTEYGDAKRMETEANRLAQLDASKQMIESMRRDVLGLKPPKSWQEAVCRSLDERGPLASLEEIKRRLRWLDQHLGDVTDIRKITRDMVDAIMLSRPGVNAALACPENSTANRYVADIAAILNAACREWEWIERTPKLRRYPEPEGRERWLTLEEWRRLEAQLPEHLKRAATFALATGLRDSKVFKLEWAQVDMQARRMTFKGTSNKLGNTIPLNDTAMSVLRAIQAAPARHLTRVFTWQKPTKLRGKLTYLLSPLNDYGKAWWKAQERAKLGRRNERGHWEGDFTWHGFRHTFNSWLAQNGAPEWIRQRLCGWATHKTSDRYTHLDVEHLRPYAAIIDRVLAGLATRLDTRQPATADTR